MKATKETKSDVKAERAVVVTTEKRGVFFGYVAESDDAIIARGTVTLKKARMCTYWSAETKSVFGLGERGPQRGSKIGPQIPTFTCNGVTGIMGCADKAVEAWESGQWA